MFDRPVWIPRSRQAVVLSFLAALLVHVFMLVWMTWSSRTLTHSSGAQPTTPPSVRVVTRIFDDAAPASITHPQPSVDRFTAPEVQAQWVAGTPPPSAERTGSATSAVAQATQATTTTDGGKASDPVQPDSIPPESKLNRIPDPSAGFRASGMEPAPRIVDAPDVVIPDSAAQREGTVVVQLLIGRDGAVQNVLVIESNPPQVFDAAVVAAFKQATTTPGYFLGLPVPSQITIEWNYTPTNRGGAVSGQGAVR
jgi:TonB family protein